MELYVRSDTVVSRIIGGETLIVPITRDQLARLSKPPPEKVVLFSDWVEPGLFKIPPPPVRPDRGSAGEFVVAHFGNMGVKQGLEIVVEAARLSAAEKAITYLLVGDGAARANV